MKKIREILKKIVNVDLKLYENPTMPPNGKLDRYEPATKEEIEYWDRRAKDGKQK